MGLSQTTGIVTKQEIVEVPGGPSLCFTRIDNIEELIQNAEDVDELPFWAELWPSALGLASYLWQSVDLAGKTVLELGSGLGLVGIVAAKKGAQVLQTDFIPAALELAKRNAEQNGLAVEQMLADWRSFPCLGQYALAVGSDILYEPDFHPHLEAILNKHVQPGGSVLLSDPGRDHAAKFLARFGPEQWDLEKYQLDVALDGKTYTIRIYQLTKIGRMESE